MEPRTMQNTTSDYNRDTASAAPPILSSVCWGAILAGAAASAALSLILLLLGTGLGLSSVSPWAHSGISGATFGLSTILWITLTALAASALGGYIAGRLRTRWAPVYTDEIYFRDTAHGFLAWSVATLFTATLLTSSVSSIISGAAQAGASLAGGAATTATASAVAAASSTMEKSDGSDNSMPYFLDTLFRKNITVDTSATGGAPQPSSDAAKAEVARIYVNAISSGVFPQEDVKYVAQVVAQNTSLSEEEAQKRTTDTFNMLKKKLDDAETAAREVADKAREVTAYGSLWLFISLLIGAFFASWAGIIGGRQSHQ